MPDLFPDYTHTPSPADAAQALEDRVTDAMRYADLSREDAERAVYGRPLVARRDDYAPPTPAEVRAMQRDDADEIARQDARRWAA